VRQGLLAFLKEAQARDPLAPAASGDDEGIVSGIAYRAMGDGPPVVLFPLGHSPVQWDPLLDDLKQTYRVILISGAHLSPTANLEARAKEAGHRKMIEGLIDRAGLAAGQKIVEVGSGSGAFTPPRPNALFDRMGIIGHGNFAASITFHRVGAQDVLPPSPQILRSGRLLPFWLGGLEWRRCSRGSARAAAEPLRAARSGDSVRGQSHRIAIRWRVCSPRNRGNHPSIWASVGHRFVGFFGGA